MNNQEKTGLKLDVDAMRELSFNVRCMNDIEELKTLLTRLKLINQNIMSKREEETAIATDILKTIPGLVFEAASKGLTCVSVYRIPLEELQLELNPHSPSQPDTSHLKPFSVGQILFDCCEASGLVPTITVWHDKNFQCGYELTVEW